MSEEEIQATEEEIVEQDSKEEVLPEKEKAKDEQPDEEVEGVDLEEEVPKGQESKYGL